MTLENHWMPFTANRDFKAHPRLLTRAEGIYYWDKDGRQLLDGISGLFNCPAGHCREEIADAASRQLRELDFVTHFQCGHPASFEFAQRIAQLTPEGIDHVFFGNSGSEAVESALKIALAYHHARGQGQRQRFVGREKAYHGVNFGGTAVGGMVRNRELFGPGLPGVVPLRHTGLE
ncbi:MAG: aspartate aminotransferase family protein, partial [Gammaproteobacteria bacterium]